MLSWASNLAISLYLGFVPLVDPNLWSKITWIMLHRRNCQIPYWKDWSLNSIQHDASQVILSHEHSDNFAILVSGKWIKRSNVLIREIMSVHYRFHQNHHSVCSEHIYNEKESVCSEHGTLLATVKQDALSTIIHHPSIWSTSDPYLRGTMSSRHIWTITIVRAINIWARREPLKAVMWSLSALINILK